MWQFLTRTRIWLSDVNIFAPNLGHYVIFICATRICKNIRVLGSRIFIKVRNNFTSGDEYAFRREFGKMLIYDLVITLHRSTRHLLKKLLICITSMLVDVFIIVFCKSLVLIGYWLKHLAQAFSLWLNPILPECKFQSKAPRRPYLIDCVSANPLRTRDLAPSSCPVLPHT